MAIEQHELDELIADAKYVAKHFVPAAAQPIEVTTANGNNMRRAHAWTFQDRQTGLTSYGNIVGKNGARWQHLKTVSDWNILSDPDDAFRSAKAAIHAMRDSL